MSDLESRVRQAFGEAKAPESVKRETIAFLSELSASCETSPTEAPSRPVCDAAPSRRMRRAPRGQESSVAHLPFSFSFAKRALFACAACLALLAACFGGVRLYAQPTAYVGIDVNPSVELSVNRFGIVVQARGINSDGSALLESVSLLNRGYAEALELLTSSGGFEPYRQESSYIEFSVTSENNDQAQTLYQQSSEQLEKLPCQGTCQNVDASTRNAALDAGMGVGRYRAALELVQLDSSVTLEDCSRMSMRELRDRIAACGGSVSSQPGTGGQKEDSASGQARHAGEGQERGMGQGSGNGYGAGRNSE